MLFLESRNILIKSVLSLFVLSGFVSCTQKKELSISQRIQTFYSYYIINRHDEALKPFPIDTFKEYCTISFLKQLPALSEKCDCDPIIQGQDYDKEWTKSLSVTLLDDNEVHKKYHVCFQGFKKYCLIVSMKEEGDWKIDNVIDDTR